MPEATTAPAAAPSTTPASSPAPLKVSLLESILASNRANAIMDPTKPPEATKVEPAKVEPKPAADPKDVALKRLTKLEKENLDYKARIAELETSSADYAALKELEKVFTTGTATEKIEALGKLAKADPTDTMEDLLAEHLSKPTAATKNALETKVDELTKKIEDDEKARKALDAKQVADAAAATAAAETKGTTAFALNALETATNDDGSPKYELCSREDNREGATTLAIEHVKALAIERNIDGETLTPDIARQLFQDAYAVVEGVLEETAAEELAAWEKKYKRTAKPATEPAKGPPPQQLQAPQALPASAGKDPGRIEPQTRPQTLAKPPVTTTKPTGSLLDQILQSNRERAVY